MCAFLSKNLHKSTPTYTHTHTHTQTFFAKNQFQFTKVLFNPRALAKKALRNQDVRSFSLAGSVCQPIKEKYSRPPLVFEDRHFCYSGR
mmetsp:Transcript_38538/g.62436  ORF Transcript_38538/g.62436 Transcript_38538/m.62436 type:complete len:89 (-) Transcript_38538:754-1020(-)